MLYPFIFDRQFAGIDTVGTLLTGIPQCNAFADNIQVTFQVRFTIIQFPGLHVLHQDDACLLEYIVEGDLSDILKDRTDLPPHFSRGDGEKVFPHRTRISLDSLYEFLGIHLTSFINATKN